MIKPGTLRYLLVCLIALALAGPVAAQSSDTQAIDDHMRGVRKKVVQKRDSALNTLLEMNDEQAKAFWPLQRQYDKDLKKLGKKERELVSEFSEIFDKLTQDSASSIAERFFDLEQERLALQQKYFEQISTDVSPVVAVQFIQLQRRFETELQIERMKYSPLAE